MMMYVPKAGANKEAGRPPCNAAVVINDASPDSEPRQANVIAAIDLAPDLGRSKMQTRYQWSLENNTRHARRRARVL